MLPDALDAEIRRQDALCDFRLDLSRESVRLQLATIEDELREAREAWQRDKKLDGDRWCAVRNEVLQTAAVAMRLYAVLDTAERDREEAQGGD